MDWRDLMKKLGKWVGYPLFFVFCLLLFAYWTFPYDRVRDFIIQEVENPRGPGDRRRPSGYQLEIVDLSPSWVTGVELTGVRGLRARLLVVPLHGRLSPIAVARMRKRKTEAETEGG